MIVASRAARHYELVVRDLKPSIMKWKVIKEIDLNLTALEDNKKQYDPNVPVMKKKDHYFVERLKEFVLYLIYGVGVRGGSITYLASTN